MRPTRFELLTMLSTPEKYWIRRAGMWVGDPVNLRTTIDVVDLGNDPRDLARFFTLLPAKSRRRDSVIAVLSKSQGVDIEAENDAGAAVLRTIAERGIGIEDAKVVDLVAPDAHFDRPYVVVRLFGGRVPTLEDHGASQ